MRVCVLSTVELSRMTLLSIYTDYLTENGIEYDIICAKKEAVNIDENAGKIYEFDAKKTANSSTVKKVMHFWKMRKMVKGIFDEVKYDFVIVWNQVTAFIFEDILKKRFDKRYCVNIRDYQYDDYPIIKGRTKKCYKHSAFNTISSDAFRKFLPEGDYLMIHSFNSSMLDSIERSENVPKNDGPIRILNIGQIRWYDHIYPLIDALADDKRFEMHFYGTGSEKIDEYIAGKNIKNVYTKGRFAPSETRGLLKNADIIFNLYGYGNYHVDTALSIKLYYAVALGIPILTYSGTHMNEIANDLGIGFSVDPGKFENFGDRLYQWYHTADLKNARGKCDDYIALAKESHNILWKTFDSALKN